MFGRSSPCRIDWFGVPPRSPSGLAMNQTESGAPAVLFYWHDIWLPHSAFLLAELRAWRDTDSVLICGPSRRKGIASVFNVVEAAPHDVPTPSKAKSQEVKTRCYSWRETICTFTEWRRLIVEHKPDILVVCDEALSLNVLLAGIANRIYGNGIVLFYAFENIIQRPAWSEFWGRRDAKALAQLLRKMFRSIVIDRWLMPIRRRVVHGGLASYAECMDVVRAYAWTPPMALQWWPVNIASFTKDGPRADFGLDAEFMVGFVGRFVAEKGISDLISAISRLEKRFGLVLIGDGPERRCIEGQISDLGLHHRCRILPPQHARTLAASYRGMDLLVLPSKPTSAWKEQYGRVLVEARLCGTRTAGSNVGAIPTVVGDPSMIFPAGNISALASTIRRAASEWTSTEGQSLNAAPSSFLEAWLLLANTCRHKQKT